MRRQPPRGFSLVEVVIALTLLCLGGLAVASGFATSSRMLAEGRSLTESAGLARRYLGRVQGAGCGAAGSARERHFVISWSEGRTPGGSTGVVIVRDTAGTRHKPDSVTYFRRCRP